MKEKTTTIFLVFFSILKNCVYATQLNHIITESTFDELSNIANEDENSMKIVITQEHLSSFLDMYEFNQSNVSESHDAAQNVEIIENFEFMDPPGLALDNILTNEYQDEEIWIERIGENKLYSFENFKSEINKNDNQIVIQKPVNTDSNSKENEAILEIFNNPSIIAEPSPIMNLTESVDFMMNEKCSHSFYSQTIHVEALEKPNSNNSITVCKDSQNYIPISGNTHLKFCTKDVSGIKCLNTTTGDFYQTFFKPDEFKKQSEFDEYCKTSQICRTSKPFSVEENKRIELAKTSNSFKESRDEPSNSIKKLNAVSRKTKNTSTIFNKCKRNFCDTSATINKFTAGKQHKSDITDISLKEKHKLKKFPSTQGRKSLISIRKSQDSPLKKQFRKNSEIRYAKNDIFISESVLSTSNKINNLCDRLKLNFYVRKEPCQICVESFIFTVHIRSLEEFVFYYNSHPGVEIFQTSLKKSKIIKILNFIYRLSTNTSSKSNTSKGEITFYRGLRKFLEEYKLSLCFIRYLFVETYQIKEFKTHIDILNRIFTFDFCDFFGSLITKNVSNSISKTFSVIPESNYVNQKQRPNDFFVNQIEVDIIYESIKNFLNHRRDVIKEFFKSIENRKDNIQNQLYEFQNSDVFFETIISIYLLKKYRPCARFSKEIVLNLFKKYNIVEISKKGALYEEVINKSHSVWRGLQTNVINSIICAWKEAYTEILGIFKLNSVENRDYDILLLFQMHLIINTAIFLDKMIKYLISNKKNSENILIDLVSHLRRILVDITEDSSMNKKIVYSINDNTSRKIYYLITNFITITKNKRYANFLKSHYKNHNYFFNLINLFAAEAIIMIYEGNLKDDKKSGFTDIGMTIKFYDFFIYNLNSFFLKRTVSSKDYVEKYLVTMKIIA